MTHFTVNNLNQTAVYWGAPLNDGYGGYGWEEPREISCRWESSTRVILDSTGKEIIPQAEVQVAEDLEEHGMLLLGELDDLDSAQADDPVEAGAREIVRFDKVPTLDGLYFYRKAFVVAYTRG